MKVAHIYLRVSAADQDLKRQTAVVEAARVNGFYIAGVYAEKASGAQPDRPELLRMIADLQPGDVVVAERIDRISRLPLPEAELLVESIRAKGARLAVPGMVDLSELAAESTGVAKIVLESVQSMLLKLTLQMARDHYEVRKERQRQGIDAAKQAARYKGGRKLNLMLHARCVASGWALERRDGAASRLQRGTLKIAWAAHHRGQDLAPSQSHPAGAAGRITAIKGDSMSNNIVKFPKRPDEDEKFELNYEAMYRQERRLREEEVVHRLKFKKNGS